MSLIINYKPRCLVIMHKLMLKTICLVFQGKLYAKVLDQ